MKPEPYKSFAGTQIGCLSGEEDGEVDGTEGTLEDITLNDKALCTQCDVASCGVPWLTTVDHLFRTWRISNFVA